MIDEDVRLGQLNNDMTYYYREGKDTAQDVTRTNYLHIQNHVPTTFILHACMHAFSGSPLGAVSICLVLIVSRSHLSIAQFNSSFKHHNMRTFTYATPILIT